MSNTVALRPQSQPPAMALAESELIDVMRASLYPGATDPSIKLVIGYCKASGLDPMQKPVHIVPMWDGDARCYRDVIMPGVGLYRTQAARTGQLAGISEPEFGPDKTIDLDGVQATFPEWCRITVRRRLSTGEIANFTACERWMENYAIKGGKGRSIAPNAMWQKRPYGQLAKCAQAQALRMGFPEMTGAVPTADEMEGKEIDGQIIENDQPPKIEPPAKPAYPDEKFAENLPAWAELIHTGKKSAERIIKVIGSKNTLSDEQIEQLTKLEPAE